MVVTTRKWGSCYWRPLGKNAAKHSKRHKTHKTPRTHTPALQQRIIVPNVNSFKIEKH